MENNKTLKFKQEDKLLSIDTTPVQIDTEKLKNISRRELREWNDKFLKDNTSIVTGRPNDDSLAMASIVVTNWEKLRQQHNMPTRQLITTIKEVVDEWYENDTKIDSFDGVEIVNKFKNYNINTWPFVEIPRQLKSILTMLKLQNNYDNNRENSEQTHVESERNV